MTAEAPSSTVTALDHLKKLIANRLDTLNDAKVKYRRYHSRIALFLIVVAACNTAVVTLSQPENAWPWWGYTAIFLSALIAVLTGVNGLFKPRQRHVRNAEALNAVFGIQSRLQWRELNEPPMSREEIDTFFSEFRAIETSFFSALAKLDVEEA